MPDKPPRLLRTGQAANEVGLSRGTLINYVREGLLVPADETPRGKYRWDLEDLRVQLAAIKADTRAKRGKRNESDR